MSMDELDLQVSWDVAREVTHSVQWDERGVRNTIKFLDEDCTVPFIARYRKESTKDMGVEKIKEVKEKYEELKAVQHKVGLAIKNVNKLGKLTAKLSDAFRHAKSVTEVEHLFLPYKSGSKRSLAERARELGLEVWAERVLQQPATDVSQAVRPEQKGLKNVEEVCSAIQHIIADLISKDKDTMDKVRDIYKHAHITIETTQVKLSTKTNTEKKTDNGDKKGSHDKKKQMNADKFENYFNFSIPVKYIKPHQVLAINRGEKQKVLQVKVNVPDTVTHRFTQHCVSVWVRPHLCEASRKLILSSVDDAHKRLIQPLMVRHLRHSLTVSAESASIGVFGSNLSRLLLTPPVRGRVVLGVDPGFRHGCKYAVTSTTGAVLETGVLYIHTSSEAVKRKDTCKLTQLIHTHKCDTVAIGNGTACRETEQFFSTHIAKGTFRPVSVQYCIVNEAGASVYSASKEAITELPNMDVTLRGAVSIARRLQDPLGELVKIEPKHLGVGMYQHDCSETLLAAALYAVVEECVSFTGVDLNTCSHALLRRISGLNPTKATKLLEYRDQHQGFTSREEIKRIKGIGPKTFEQCAGFVRIMPETSPAGKASNKAASECAPAENDSKATIECAPAENDSVKPGAKRKLAAGKSGKSKKAKTEGLCACDTLDMTAIHPESYHIAESVLKKFHMDKAKIGQEEFIRQFKNATKETGLACLAGELGADVPTMKLIMDGLTQKIGHDIRDEFSAPLFKQGIVSMNSLKPGTVLTGKVTNNTHFGAFVDVGVESDGLIHTSKMNKTLMRGRGTLGIGDRVEVKVDSVDVGRRRLGLRLLKLLS